jgi:hypothetical protein
MRIILVKKPGLAYSDRYIAESNPNGSAIMMVHPTRYRVPIIGERIPPARIPSEGIVVRNFQLSDPQPLLTRKYTTSMTGMMTRKVDALKQAKAID